MLYVYRLRFIVLVTVETAATVPLFTDHAEKQLENPFSRASLGFTQTHVNFTKQVEMRQQDNMKLSCKQYQVFISQAIFLHCQTILNCIKDGPTSRSLKNLCFFFLLSQVLASLRTVRNNFAALTNMQERAPSK